MKSQFSSLSQFKMLKTKHEKHWTFFSDIDPPYYLLQADKTKLKFAEKSKLLLRQSLMEQLLCSERVSLLIIRLVYEAGESLS